MILMDAFIVLLIVIIIICWSCYRRKLSKAAYGIVCLDMILQVFNFLAKHLGKNPFTSFLARWPNSLMGLIDKYTDGIVFLIIAWAYVILVIYFIFLTLRIFFKK